MTPIERVYDAHTLPQPIPWPENIDIEAGDRFIPKGPGFVRDFVLATRRVETSSEFCVWSALFAVSSAMGRRCSFKWYPNPLFTNLFLVFLAPPGVAKKSTAVLLAAKMLKAIPRLYQNEEPYWRRYYGVEMHFGRITPEGLVERMLPVSAQNPITKHIEQFGSELTLIADEMTVVVDKANYNSGLVDRMTSLFDCKDHEQVYTKKEGAQDLHNVFFNFFGATTPDSFAKSVPPEAYGGGLLSRIVLVYQEAATRMFPEPSAQPGAPTFEEMVRRLGWIGREKAGTYQWTDEAKEAYHAWYTKVFKPKQYSMELEETNSRLDTLIVRVATLIAAQRYELGTKVGLEDFHLAHDLCADTSTLKDVFKPTESNEIAAKRRVARVAALISQKGTVGRRELKTMLGKNIKAEELDAAVMELVRTDRVIIYRFGKVAKPQVPENLYRGEEYVWNALGNRRYHNEKW